MSWLEHPRLDRSLLERYHFDESWFESCRKRIEDGSLTQSTHLVKGSIQPAPQVLPLNNSREAKEAGEDALSAGQVAAVCLNGGMATRFGGVVKGTVTVFDGHSFIALKASNAAHAGMRYGKSVPFVLMNSFATEEATAEHLAAHQQFGLHKEDLLQFSQSISIRLRPDGSLFVDETGDLSYHAPGHGDFFSCIKRSGVLQKLLDRGVRYILFSNIDNLGATVDPLVVGHHIVASATMTCEVTEKRKTASGAWDKGGAPALLSNGRVQVVEGFRFPSDFPQETLPDFSTNNMVFSAQALLRDIPLDHYVVQKKVGGQPVLQLESITCEASGSIIDGQPAFQLSLLRVPRDGPQGRFFPIKEPADLSAQSSILKARLDGSLAPS